MDDLMELLKMDFTICESQNEIIISSNSDYYPEVLIKYIYNEKDKKYSILYQQKNDVYLIHNFSKKEQGLIFLYFFCKNKLSKTNYDEEMQFKILKAKSLEEIEDIFEKNVDPKLYSFFSEKDNAIVLESTPEELKYNVTLYTNGDKLIIVQNRPINNASLVMYNYSVKYEEFLTYTNKLGIFEHIRNKEVQNDLKKLYLLGK